MLTTAREGTRDRNISILLSSPRSTSVSLAGPKETVVILSPAFEMDSSLQAEEIDTEELDPEVQTHETEG